MTCTCNQKPCRCQQKKTSRRRNPSQRLDLPSILEACAKAGVATLKFGDIEVTFKTPSHLVHHTDYESPSQGDLTIPENFSASPVSEQPRIETIDRDLLEDMRRSQLMIDDPLSFEQEMIDEYTRRDTDVGRETVHS